MAVLTISDLKNYFETYDKPTQGDFTNLIDTLSTAMNFIKYEVPVGSYTTISDSFNENLTITLHEKEVVLLNYSGSGDPTADGTYVFNVNTAGTYGYGSTQVQQSDFIRISPDDVISDIQGSSTTYSSNKLHLTFPTHMEVNDNFVRYINPDVITGDIVTVTGDVQGKNIIDPDEISYSNGILSFKLYDGTTKTKDISQVSNQHIFTVTNTTGSARVDFNSMIASNRATTSDENVYLLYTDGSSIQVYLVTMSIPDGTLTINSDNDMMIIYNDSTDFLSDYYTQSEVNVLIDNATIGITYSYDNWAAMNAVSSASLNETAVVRATVSNTTAYGSNNQDTTANTTTLFAAKYSDYVDVDGGTTYVVYSPVYKWNGSTWDYNYQMTSPHSHVAADITDFSTRFGTDLAAHHLSDLLTNSSSTHFTSAYETTLLATATDSAVVHNSGNESVAGVKTFSDEPIFSGLTASNIVHTDGTKALVSIAPLTAYNKDFGTTHTTIAYGDHSHSTYALDAAVVHKSGENNVGRIGFNCTADSNVDYTASTGLISTKLYIGEYSAAETGTGAKDNLTIDKDYIMFGSHALGNPFKISKLSYGNGIEFIHSSKVCQMALGETGIYVSGSATPTLKVNSSGVTINTISADSLVTPSILTEVSGVVSKITRDSWHLVGNSGGANDFQNSWVNEGSSWNQPLRYKRDIAGNVHIQGNIKSGSSATAYIFTLPSGYYNAKTMYGTLAKGSDGTSIKMTIENDGDVKLSDANLTNQYINVIFALD